MNTPPKKKRWKLTDLTGEGPTPPAGNYDGFLDHPDFAVPFARLVSTFVHLEDAMSYVLAVLMQSPSRGSAQYMLRSVRAVTTRIDIMRDLLETTPWNRNLPDEYDEIIREFAALNRLRNTYAHGSWFTEMGSNAVYFAEENNDGAGFNRARPATKEELEEVCERIAALRARIFKGPAKELERLRVRQAALERSYRPKKA